MQLGGGNYSGLMFGVSSDGIGGTDITVGAAPTYYWIDGSADWNTATNRSSGVMPGVAASATMADAGDNTVTIGPGDTMQVASVTQANGNTLLDAGTLATGVTLSGGTSLSIGSAGLLSAATANAVSGSGTVINFGTVVSSATAVGYGYGIKLGGAGSVTNGSATDTTALIQGNRGMGVKIRGQALVNNYGTITRSTDQSVVVYADATVVNHTTGILPGGVALDGAGSTLQNFGTIASRLPVGISTGDIVVNQAGAVIVGTAAGVYIGGRASGNSTLVNDGTITGPSAVELSYAGASLNATIIDAGTIVGGLNVLGSDASGTLNLLVQFVPDPDFVSGVVNGGGGGLLTQRSATLEFTTGAAVGTLTGDSAAFVNFATASVDPGASCVFSGSNTLGAGTRWSTPAR